MSIEVQDRTDTRCGICPARLGNQGGDRAGGKAGDHRISAAGQDDRKRILFLHFDDFRKSQSLQRGCMRLAIERFKDSALLRGNSSIVPAANQRGRDVPE